MTVRSYQLHDFLIEMIDLETLTRASEPGYRIAQAGRTVASTNIPCMRKVRLNRYDKL
jgi:hypothetical protein